MKKKFRAKVSGVFDIVQLSGSTFSEVRDKLKENNYQIDQQFTSRDECYIEAYGDNGMRCVNRGDMVFTDEGGKKRKSGHWVTGTYQKCSRFGKKLSNFQRCW